MKMIFKSQDKIDDGKINTQAQFILIERYIGACYLLGREPESLMIKFILNMPKQEDEYLNNWIEKYEAKEEE